MKLAHLASIGMGACLASAAAAHQADIEFNRLPDDIQRHILDVRNSCTEQHAEGVRVSDPAQGVTVVDIDNDGSTDFLVDNEEICGTHMAGANCSNRGCDLLIWQQRRTRWVKVFDEHLHAKFISINESNRHLQMMAVSIYAGDERCKPDPNMDYTSGKTCDRVVIFKRGSWRWLAPWGE